MRIYLRTGFPGLLSKQTRRAWERGELLGRFPLTLYGLHHHNTVQFTRQLIISAFFSGLFGCSQHYPKYMYNRSVVEGQMEEGLWTFTFSTGSFFHDLTWNVCDYTLCYRRYGEIDLKTKTYHECGICHQTLLLSSKTIRYPYLTFCIVYIRVFRFYPKT